MRILKLSFRFCRPVLISFFFLFISFTGFAQELKCDIQVVAPTVEGTNKRVFESMQQSLREFMNGQKWTDNLFAESERIECTFLINITKVVSEDEFMGTIQIKARRPVYGSSYYTVLFNRIDDSFQCKYTEYQAITYNPNTFDSNLVGILAFYANIILGYDYDSYSNMGGTPYFAKAQQIVARAQGATESGWKAFENKRNRYWIVNDVLDEQVKPLRSTYYKYHRMALDNMSSKVVTARGDMLEALTQISKVTRTKPSTLAVQMFFDAKSEEIISVFSESNQVEKAKLMELLTEIDPANSTKYQTAFKASN